MTVAKALATVAPDHGAVGAGVVLSALDRLTEDEDALVRGAAFASLAGTGCPAAPAARAVRAQADRAWQVRAGAATALSAADAEVAVPALAKALGDPNADVRKAAVLALVRHAGSAGAGSSSASTVAAALAALATATADTDADVRAYASRAL